MESVIPDDSPLAGYLEGVADDTKRAPSPTPPGSPISFAPRGLPGASRLSQLRERIAPLKLGREQSRDSDSRRSKRSSYHSKISNNLVGPSRDGVLDRFRYIIISSQLLNARSVAHGYDTHRRPSAPEDRAVALVAGASHSAVALCGTAGIAFALAWIIHNLRNFATQQTQTWRVCLAVAIAIGAAITTYLLVKRQLLAYSRRRVLALASSYIAQAQSFDAASGAAMQLIQEVEIVSRGYRISTPMPPASRLEEQTQIKRCLRLRRTLQRSCTSLLETYIECYKHIKDFTVQLDFERYCDVYEITRSDLDDIAHAHAHYDEIEDTGSLKVLQLTLQRLHLSRKAFGCALLSLGAGRIAELSQWNKVSDTLQNLSIKSYDCVSMIDGILSEDSSLSAPDTPQDPLSPTRERVRTQMRRFTTLSQGIRELQAKIYLLREESDKALVSTEDVTELGPRLLEQYDTFGADLRNLIQEWEEGRRTLASNITKHEKRASMSPNGFNISRSTTPSSLSGRTAVSGSPAEALKILNGEIPPPMHVDSSEEELFEAVALPRARSALTREERLAKMREDRVSQALARERADAGRHMVKELESVIRMRPRTIGQRTSL